jgi:hypothetical protein
MLNAHVVCIETMRGVKQALGCDSTKQSLSCSNDFSIRWKLHTAQSYLLRNAGACKLEM